MGVYVGYGFKAIIGPCVNYLSVLPFQPAPAVTSLECEIPVMMSNAVKECEYPGVEHYPWDNKKLGFNGGLPPRSSIDTSRILEGCNTLPDQTKPISLVRGRRLSPDGMSLSQRPPRRH